MVVISPIASVSGTVALPRVWTSSATPLSLESANPPMAAVSTNMAVKAARSLPRTERLIAPVVGAGDGRLHPPAGGGRSIGTPASRSAARHEPDLRRHLERLGGRRVGRAQAGPARLALERMARELDLVQRLRGHLEALAAHLGDGEAGVAGLFEEAEGQAAVGRGQGSG